MANQYNLVRSFYGWVAKTERALKKNRRVLEAFPKFHPTTITGAFEVSTTLLPVLAGTVHHERASYWHKTFESIIADGWKDGRGEA